MRVTGRARRHRPRRRPGVRARDRHGWIRATGYHESVAGELDAYALDRLHAESPVRIQHRSGALWIVNVAGMLRLGLSDGDHPGVERGADGLPTGRLWRADSLLRNLLPPSDPPVLTAVGSRLLQHGITAVTDATPDLTPDTIEALAAAAASGTLPQRLCLLGAPLSGELPTPLTAGPYKIVLADSGLPNLATLADRIRAAHAAGRSIAAHCVTREALVLLLTALDDAGGQPGDRIEHAALVPTELVPDLARRGLRVITQPGFLADRGDDYLRDVPPTDLPDLYRCARLIAAGVPLALSSDAPYGPVDPWTVMAAAVHRRTGCGAVTGPDERLTPKAVLAAYLAPSNDPGGPPRRIVIGAPADLVLLNRPLDQALAELPRNPVRTTLMAGHPAPAP